MRISIRPPQTSYEWHLLLIKIKKREDDFAVLSAMQKGKIDWIDSVGLLFVKELLETVDFRLQDSVNKLQKSFQNIEISESILTANIRELKREFVFLYHLVNLSCIPEGNRKEYQRILKDNADKIQQNLENSAKKDLTGRLAFLVRNNKLNDLGVQSE